MGEARDGMALIFQSSCWAGCRAVDRGLECRPTSFYWEASDFKVASRDAKALFYFQPQLLTTPSLNYTVHHNTNFVAHVPLNHILNCGFNLFFVSF